VTGGDEDGEEDEVNEDSEKVHVAAAEPDLAHSALILDFNLVMPLAGLLDLPVELLLIILQDLPEADLYTSAQLSRRLNILALQLYLDLHDHPHPEDDVIISEDNITSVLPALRIALFHKSAKRLQCTFTVNRVIAELKEVTRYVSKLDQLEEVVLNFPGIKLFKESWRTHKHRRTNTYDEGVQQMDRLFCALALKGCRNLTVCRGVLEELRSVGRGAHMIDLHGLPPRASWSHPIVRKTLGVVLGDKVHDMPDWFRRDSRLPPLTNLVAFHARSELLSRAELLRWVVCSMERSANTVTTLSLSCLSLSSGVWGVFLAQITLPKLSDLSISSAALSIADLVKFLARHQIASISLCGGILFDRHKGVRPGSPPDSLTSPRLLPDKALKKLTTLRGTPDYIIRFLHPESHFPALTHVTIDRVISTTARDHLGAFRRLTQVEIKHPLHLTIVGPINELDSSWFPFLRSARCVTSLTLGQDPEQVDSWHKGSSLELAAMFPYLTAVTVCSRRRSPAWANTVLTRLRDICPSVKSFQVMGSKGVVAAFSEDGVRSISAQE
jgi:hypothetical protein